MRKKYDGNKDVENYRVEKNYMNVLGEWLRKKRNKTIEENRMKQKRNEMHSKRISETVKDNEDNEE